MENQLEKLNFFKVSKEAFRKKITGMSVIKNISRANAGIYIETLKSNLEKLEAK